MVYDKNELNIDPIFFQTAKYLLQDKESLEEYSKLSGEV